MQGGVQLTWMQWDADGVQCLILVCSLLVLCSSLKQQVARILELAREKQAAELRVLRDTSER